ncbi:2-polyprenyl-6-methoxyphenol hydroxylase-like FAD-dependent oxidoreductase [Nocardiopsis sp. Huas11]|uniref:FAD-dependent oxidoreductase n=1 Tax=Nocardiopsis sp. Huas11 TaxID=2183912 RepID=UPI000EB019DD|nr:FAD-dependent monooxygenase [Nocardiopsis sp. Huas11]RKS06991.1 2-polyprenyl-6-methoxyphenol hydroxylase-like FAD-dependent oxidoreductase [Nocardiopsis sp. Huas11]
MTKALIIGGGIGGPVAAAALRRVGVDAVVYEAHAGPGDHLGSFLGLAPNGLAGLDTLGMLDPVLAASAFPSTRIEMVDRKGRRLGLLDDGSDRLPDRLRTITVTRGALQRALAESALDQGVPIEYGRRFTGYTEGPDGVVAEFADGSTAEGDVLIGADGLHSRVRGVMDPDAPRPDYTGVIGSGGHVPALDIEPTPPATTRMVYGRRAFFGYQTTPEGGVFWFTNLGHSELTREEIAARGDEEWKRFALDAFAGDPPVITTILEAEDPARLRPLGSYDMASLPRWHRGRAGLLGDAAHAVSSSSGQGASLAIEDALVLARCLRDIPAVPDALAEYEAQRRDRVEKIAAEGRRRSNQKIGSDHPVALVMRDLMLRAVFAIISRFDGTSWIHGYRVDIDAPARTGSGPRA